VGRVAGTLATYPDPLLKKVLQVRVGKGMTARTIELEKKGVQSFKSWLAVRPKITDDHLFLNRDDEPLGERGVQKLLAKYCAIAGITKRISPHSLRHTFASFKAEAGVSPFQLQQWLGHSSLETTQIYVHLARKNARKVMEATTFRQPYTDPCEPAFISRRVARHRPATTER